MVRGCISNLLYSIYMTDRDDPRTEALRFLKSHQAGVLATVGQGGQPHASAVYYIVDENFNLYFLTQSSSRKAQAIAANPRVAFTVGTQDVPQTVQLEGIAEEIHYQDTKDEKMTQLAEVLMSASTYFAPVTKLDPASIILVWIQPKWVRWADYATAVHGTENVWKEIQL